jgi:hypothetical protein
MQDHQAIISGSDGGEGFVDEEKDEIGSPEDMASSRTEELKQKLLKLRATKKDHDMAGEQLSRDIKTVERQLLDAIYNEG